MCQRCRRDENQFPCVFVDGRIPVEALYLHAIQDSVSLDCIRQLQAVFPNIHYLHIRLCSQLLPCWDRLLFKGILRSPPALHRCLPQSLGIELFRAAQEILLAGAGQLARHIADPVIDPLEQVPVLCQQPPDGSLIGEQLFLCKLGHDLAGGPVLVQRHAVFGVVGHESLPHAVHIRAHVLRHILQCRFPKLTVLAAALHVVGQLVDQRLPHRIGGIGIQ